MVTVLYSRTFFDDTLDVSGWIDANLKREVSSSPRADWAYVFRETVATIWFLRNKFLFDVEFLQPDVHTTIRRIFERSRNFRLAWDRVGSPVIVL